MDTHEKSDEPDGAAGDIDGLIRVLSHQLKSPINAIESLLSVVAEGYTGSIDSKTSVYIQKAVGKAQEARKLISDLMSFEQSAQVRERDFQRINLTSLISTVSATYRVIASEKNITFQVKTPEAKNIFVKGQAAGLESAIRNLIENAINFTPGLGSVEVGLSVTDDGKRCELRVQDTGCGIPQEDIPNLFKPFFRSSASKASVTGTGLGLPIVKRVIQRHGGSVVVESTVHKGTTFVLSLPAAAIEERSGANAGGKKVVIIGGVTAGPKAAARLRRLDPSADITIIEKGELLSYAGCGIPSYIRGLVKSPKALMSTADNTLRDVHFFESIKNICIMKGTEAIAIDRPNRALRVRSCSDRRQWSIPYDVLILATGAAAMIPPICGIDAPGVHSLYNIGDAEAIKRRLLEKPASDVCILGGGLVGIETAESLLLAGGRVTVLEKDAHVLKLFDPDIADKIAGILSAKGIKVITGVTVSAIKPSGDGLTIESDKGDFRFDCIILSTGVKPNAGLAADAGLALGASGGIQVNEFLQTSDPTIYAVGDCAESRHLVSGKYSYLPLGSISTKMGRIAADTICGKKAAFPGSIGTTMFKIFDIQVARTGLETRGAKDCGFEPVGVVVSGLDKAHYEPAARSVIIKAIADRTTQRLLGAQGYGQGDVATRVEVLASAIARGLSLHEVFTLDLGYYPAFNTPIDMAQTVCAVLKNKIDGICETVTLEQFERRPPHTHVVDVNPHQEYAFASIPDSINVPLENLRQEGIPFAKNQRIILYSKTSSRAYEAFCYLRSQGWEHIAILEGGYLFWKK